MGRVLVVGCEPESFGPENIGQMELSPAVAAAVPEAVASVERVVHESHHAVAVLAATAASDPGEREVSR